MTFLKSVFDELFFLRLGFIFLIASLDKGLGFKRKLRKQFNSGIFYFIFVIFLHISFLAIFELILNMPSIYTSAFGFSFFLYMILPSK